MLVEPSERRAEVDPVYRYDLPTDETDRLVAELLNEHEPIGDDRFVCYKFDGRDKYANIGRQIEGRVFKDTFNNSADDMVSEYGPYEEQSTFFISIDRESEKATGALRVIRNGKNGLKTINDLTHPPYTLTEGMVTSAHNIDDFDTCWDIGTVAVLPENRSAQGSIAVQLYRAMYVAAMDEHIEHIVSIVDEKPLRKLTDYLGIPFVPLAGQEGVSYLGSEKSQPVYGYVPDFYKKMNRNRFTMKGVLARKVLSRLVKGSRDSELQF